jgi:hypothetical protein
MTDAAEPVPDEAQARAELLVLLSNVWITEGQTVAEAVAAAILGAGWRPARGKGA